MTGKWTSGQTTCCYKHPSFKRAFLVFHLVAQLLPPDLICDQHHSEAETFAHHQDNKMNISRQQSWVYGNEAVNIPSWRRRERVTKSSQDLPLRFQSAFLPAPAAHNQWYKRETLDLGRQELSTVPLLRVTHVPVSKSNKPTCSLSWTSSNGSSCSYPLPCLEWRDRSFIFPQENLETHLCSSKILAQACFRGSIDDIRN